MGAVSHSDRLNAHTNTCEMSKLKRRKYRYTAAMQTYRNGTVANNFGTLNNRETEDIILNILLIHGENMTMEMIKMSLIEFEIFVLFVSFSTLTFLSISRVYY